MHFRSGSHNIFRRRALFTPVILISLLGLSIAACSKKEKDPPNQAPPPAEETQPPAPAPTDPPAASDSASQAPQSMADAWAAAKARGVRFRGIGQEPGWIVDVVGADGSERLEVSADYGDLKLKFEPVNREENATPPRTFYRAKSGAHSIEVEIIPQPCSDAMSGQPYDHTVIVRLDARELHGCGKAL
ncbi:MAG TPA: hypothetical protein VFR10_01050 [bacterium]|nr:hypothetical protein [bacterium]